MVMPTTGTPLLIVAVLTSVTISSSSCILDVSQYQSPSETNENLFPCVKSVYTRTEDACRIADLNEGRARTNATQCVIEHRYIECYCSEKCSEDELRTLVRSLANEGTPWEKNCIKNFLENWKNATSTALTSGTTNGSKDASELRMSEAEKSMADEGGESFTRKTLVPEVSGSSHANQTTENERRELRMARERLLHSTAPCVALYRQDRHTIRQMRYDAAPLAVKGRSRTAPSGVAADEHCSRSFVSIFW
ncbi:hypothetical protein Y032_0088g2129 [Ancylostoma ceylanicum]|uniref:Uncharacterized protein n=1 Tax=Ancylostoma ceylanicum TaxID=53326 RepID=A0A016TMS6_9BILA|nr:hypothetical protein Y032_0088g2129 [Ancylostoma ceylanicum]